MVGRVLVAGSINMDIVARAPRFPRIGETVAGFDLHFFPGGKGANQAVAAAKSGASTELIGKIGQDAFGRDLKAFLAKQGVGLARVMEITEAQTGTAIITVSDAHNTIVVVAGANGLVGPSDMDAVNIEPGDILVSQFEIPVETIKDFFSRGRQMGARTILNPAPVVTFERSLLDLIDILVLNETEVGVLTGADVGENDEASALIKLARSLRRTERQAICVTLGQRGVVALVDSDVIQIAGHAVVAIDTTGAGDCFVGAMAARLAAGASIPDALKYANRAASICIQRQGAGPSMPTLAEVMEHLN